MPRERRVHPRLAASIRAQVQTEAGEVELSVCNLSRGGALLEAPWEIGAGEGALLKVRLRLPDDAPSGTVALCARLVHQGPASGPPGEGPVAIGVRFVDVSPEQSLLLLALLDRALEGGHGAGGRAHPRLSHRLEVRCFNRQEHKALLRDVSHGGLGLWVDTALERGEPVTVDLPHPDGGHFELVGTVVDCRPLEEARGGFRAGVRLEPLSPGTRNALQRFLRGLYHP